jgi:hypothetical protein
MESAFPVVPAGNTTYNPFPIGPTAPFTLWVPGGWFKLKGE